MSADVIDFPKARAQSPAHRRERQPVRADTADYSIIPVRVMLRGGWRHLESLAAAFVHIVRAAEAGERMFMIEMREPARNPPDATEPEHAQ